MENLDAKSAGLTSWRRLRRFVPYVVVVIILLIIPALIPTYLQSMMTKVVIFALLAISLNLLFGYTGLFSFGHAAFFGVAGYAAGILTVSYGIESFWITAPIALLMTLATAAVFGVICLRLSGFYFALITLSLSQLLLSIASVWYSVTMGPSGFLGIPRPNVGLPGINLGTPCLTTISSWWVVQFVISYCTGL